MSVMDFFSPNGKKKLFRFCKIEFLYIFAPAFEAKGALAQLVEQRTENPCVPSSILGGTTFKKKCKKENP